MLSVPESERTVLEGILNRTTEVEDVLEIVQPSDFSVGIYKTVFEIIKTLHEKSQPTDVVTIHAAAGTKFDVCILAELSGGMTSKQSALHHARQVKDSAIRRVVAAQGEQLIRAAKSGIETAQMIEQATAALSEIAIADTSNESRSIGEVIQQVWNETTSRMEGPTATAGYPTGYQQLDRLLGGWMPKKLYILAGRPGMGKTAFMLNSMYRSRIPCQIFSIEMDDKELVGRLICLDQHINTLALRDARLNEDQFSRFGKGCEAVNESGIKIDDSVIITVEEIKVRARVAVKKHGCKIIAVDHVGLVKPTSLRDSREQQIGHISWQLKALARELNVPVILLSQLNRKVEERTDKRPVLSDLRDSGSLEQDADVVIMLYNGSYYANDKTYKTGVKSVTDIITRKHRAGPVGTVPLNFLPEFTALEE
ncbi:replicative DNA helicase [Desulfovibrio gilichinskyi]|uniref:DNA 5'-3' helicase n=1 Tax=Desulfovibrio gilichinskyi TaxID=1519643 RepID=A0A1X7C3B5_9BACT|nr:replicative DNA helicase [Desulfovibrio gilichinskyi]SME89282.1 replicative DNA helicase [Desulfovibrio gilichinskyi]